MKTLFNTSHDHFTMIKNQTSKIVRCFTLWILAVMIVSCNEDMEVEIEPVEFEMTANIDISGIVKDYTDINGSKHSLNETLSQDYYVEVRYSVYDEDGYAVITETVSLQDFTKKESITKSIKNGVYTIVACAYISDKNGEAEFWRPENISDLDNYKIKHSPNGGWIGSYSVLGIWKRTVAINKSQTVNINITSVVSMVYFNFTKCDLAGIKKLRFKVESFNDYYDVDKMQGVIKELNIAYNFDFTVTSSAVITAICYFPTSKFNVSWQGFDAGDNEVNNGVIPSSAVKAGETKVITIDTGFGITVNTLTVNPTIINFAENETNTKTATVTTNAANWEFTAETSASWLTVEKQGNTLRFTPKSLNTGTSDRSTIVTVKAGNAIPVPVQVTQNPTPDDKLEFEDIVNSTYTASGTPLTEVEYPAPSSWSGFLFNYPENQFYEITNWANFENFPMWLDYDNGKLFLDIYTVIHETNTDKFYFAVGYQSGSNFYTAQTTYKYEVNYNKTTRTLDFTGTFNGYPAIVVIRAVNKTTGAGTIFTDTGLLNAKLVLTPVSSAMPSGSDAVMKSKTSVRKTNNGIVNSVPDIIPLENVKSLEELKLKIK